MTDDMTPDDLLKDIAGNLERLVSEDGYLANISISLRRIADALGAEGGDPEIDHDSGHIKQLTQVAEELVKQLNSVIQPAQGKSFVSPSMPAAIRTTHIKKQQ